MPLLSVIIPTIDEAANLPALLADLQAQQGVELEIIVADGGSRDATCELATRHGATVVSGLSGRGRQMNAGVVAANGDWLLFLHADSRLSDSSLLCHALVCLAQGEVLSGHRRVAGHFPVQFCRNLAGHDLAFRFLEQKSLCNRPQTINGDQGCLLRREFFTQLGGFDETLPFLEDQKLAERIRIQGAWVTLPGHLATSARRFEVEGFHRCYLRMGIIMGLHSAGVAPLFRRASTLYPVQQDTARLLLWPYFLLIWRMMWHDLGFAGSVRAWLRVGRFCRQNIWQLFFFIDVALRPWVRTEDQRCLRFYDRWLAQLISFSFVDAISGGLAFVLCLGVLAPWCWLVAWSNRRGEELG